MNEPLRHFVTVLKTTSAWMLAQCVCIVLLSMTATASTEEGSLSLACHGKFTQPDNAVDRPWHGFSVSGILLKLNGEHVTIVGLAYFDGTYTVTLRKENVIVFGRGRSFRPETFGNLFQELHGNLNRLDGGLSVTRSTGFGRWDLTFDGQCGIARRLF